METADGERWGPTGEASKWPEKGILKIPNTHQHSQLISSYTHNSSTDFPCKIIGHKVYQVLFILSMN